MQSFSSHRPGSRGRRVILLAAVAGGLTFAVSGCAKEAEAPVATMVYIDSVTRKPVVQAVSSEFPAVNPATGRRTLRPAAYCDECRAWHAVPPMEEIQRRPEALVCPKSKGRLRFDGPMPGK